MTLSLAFLAPEIVKAAVEGRLPRGFGLKRLVDLPMAWPDQWRTLGLQAPANALGTGPPPAHLCSRRARSIHPNRIKCRGSRPPTAIRNPARRTLGKQQPWKRKCAARDFRRYASRKVA
jgi:hypothetical protein